MKFIRGCTVLVAVLTATNAMGHEKWFTEVSGKLFSPNHPLAGSQAHLLGLLQVGIALALFYGVFTRVAAVVLVLTWFRAIGVIGLEAALENIHYLGFAIFFFFTGRGTCSINDPRAWQGSRNSSSWDTIEALGSTAYLSPFVRQLGIYRL
jgi:uncharacterized membrane protein YphA (DoxX/SURF4 family)